MANALRPVLLERGIGRYIGISGAGVTVAGDRKSRRGPGCLEQELYLRAAPLVANLA